MEQPKKMDGWKLLKRGAMIRTLTECSAMYVVYELKNGGITEFNTLPYEFVLLKDKEGQGSLIGATFSDTDWDNVDADSVNYKIMTGEEFRMLEWFHKMKQIVYWDCLGLGPFEWVVEGFGRNLLSIKMADGKQIVRERMYAPVDLFVIVKNAMHRTWVPRTDKGEAYIKHIERQKGTTFTGKIWDNYRDRREFDRVRLENPEWWYRQSFVSRAEKLGLKLPDFDPGQLEHLRKPLPKRDRTRPLSIRAAELYRMTEEGRTELPDGLHEESESYEEGKEDQ